MRNKFRILLIVILVAVMAVSGYKVVSYFWQNYRAAEEFRELDENAGGNHTYLHEKNGDYAGWITLPDTELNYPVMYTPDDPQHYLRLDFNEEYSLSGTPFADSRTDMDDPVNMIIYGHNMKTGDMFGVLTDFEKEGFLGEHPEFTFEDVNGNVKTYEIFAWGQTEADTGEGSVYAYADPDSREEFERFVEILRNNFHVNADKIPEWGDSVITLSTCSYHSDTGRYIVAGVLKK